MKTRHLLTIAAMLAADETQAMYETVRQHGEIHSLQGVSHDDLGRTLNAALQAPLLAFLDRNLKTGSVPGNSGPD